MGARRGTCAAAKQVARFLGDPCRCVRRIWSGLFGCGVSIGRESLQMYANIAGYVSLFIVVMLSEGTVGGNYNLKCFSGYRAILLHGAEE